ncbi:MAG: hypothetical protein IJU62_00320, partial [Muribaculaceae bacterium]|nr:hypothetical protein [Muribaculaceae bacterium]
VAICTYYHNDVVSVAFRFISAKYFVILPTSAFCIMGNRKGGEGYPFIAILRCISWHCEFLKT